MSSKRRARFRSMFIWTRSLWRSSLLAGPPSSPPPWGPPNPSRLAVPSTDPESSNVACLACNLEIPTLPLACLLTLACCSCCGCVGCCCCCCCCSWWWWWWFAMEVSPIGCFIIRRLTFVSVWINCKCCFRFEQREQTHEVGDWYCPSSNACFTNCE